MEKWLVVGKITGTQGLRGEVRVHPYTESPERFEELAHLFLDTALKGRLNIESVRCKKNIVVLKFQGIDTIEEAERLKNREVYIDREKQGKTLEEGEHYIVDLIGLKVIDDQQGELGVLKDIMTNTAQDLYVVKLKNGKELLIPGVETFVKDIDLELGEIRVHLIEGMLE